MSCAFIFPGQGVQKIGMGSSIFNGFRCGMDVLREVDDAISFKISNLIFDGSLAELTLSKNAQPAIFAVSMAIVAVLEKEFGFDVAKNVQYLAGHSLGEYSALCVAGACSVFDGARLVRLRGELMSEFGGAKGQKIQEKHQESKNDVETTKNNQSKEGKECGKETKFLMAAILGLGVGDVEKLVLPYQTADNVCVIANDNSSKQVVVSGHFDAVSKVAMEAKKFGATKVLPLNTSGPFHSPLMAAASIEFDKFLAKDFKFAAIKTPVIMNNTAMPLREEDSLPDMLVSHITKRVRWRESMEFLVEAGVEKIVEIGPGKVQSSILKRTYPDMNTFSIETVGQIEDFVKF